MVVHTYSTFICYTQPPFVGLKLTWELDLVNL
jgi:hypothetical protein